MASIVLRSYLLRRSWFFWFSWASLEMGNPENGLAYLTRMTEHASKKKRKTEPHEKTKKKEKKRKRAWPMGQGAWQGVGGAYFASSVQFAVAIADHRLQVAGPILRLIQSTSERFVLDGQVGTTADRWFCVLNRAGRRARRNPAGNTAKNTVQRQTPRSRAFTWFYLVLPSFFPSFTEFYRASPSFT